MILKKILLNSELRKICFMQRILLLEQMMALQLRMLLQFKNELKMSEPELTLRIEKVENIGLKVLTRDTMNKVIRLLLILPNGVQTMSAPIIDLVESSINLGVVTTSKKGILFESAIRSNVKSLKYNLLNQLRAIALILDISLEVGSDYPAWEYQSDSKVRNIFNMVYKKIYKKEPKEKSIKEELSFVFLKKRIKILILFLLDRIC